MCSTTYGEARRGTILRGDPLSDGSVNQARSRAIDWLRIAPEKGQESVVSTPHGPLESEWEEVAPGISCNLLATDARPGQHACTARTGGCVSTASPRRSRRIVSA